MLHKYFFIFLIIFFDSFSSSYARNQVKTFAHSLYNHPWNIKNLRSIFKVAGVVGAGALLFYIFKKYKNRFLKDSPPQSSFTKEKKATSQDENLSSKPFVDLPGSTQGARTASPKAGSSGSESFFKEAPKEEPKEEPTEEPKKELENKSLLEAMDSSNFPVSRKKIINKMFTNIETSVLGMGSAMKSARDEQKFIKVLMTFLVHRIEEIFKGDEKLYKKRESSFLLNGKEGLINLYSVVHASTKDYQSRQKELETYAFNSTPFDFTKFNNLSLQELCSYYELYKYMSSRSLSSKIYNNDENEKKKVQELALKAKDSIYSLIKEKYYFEVILWLHKSFLYFFSKPYNADFAKEGIPLISFGGNEAMEKMDFLLYEDFKIDFPEKLYGCWKSGLRSVIDPYDSENVVMYELKELFTSPVSEDKKYVLADMYRFLGLLSILYECKNQKLSEWMIDVFTLIFPHFSGSKKIRKEKEELKKGKIFEDSYVKKLYLLTHAFFHLLGAEDFKEEFLLNIENFDEVKRTWLGVVKEGDQDNPISGFFDFLKDSFKEEEFSREKKVEFNKKILTIFAGVVPFLMGNYTDRHSEYAASLAEKFTKHLV